jgi:hypothetical protein
LSFKAGDSGINCSQLPFSGITPALEQKQFTPLLTPPGTF